MPIISNFPAERNWEIVIDALKAAIMSGEVTATLESTDGEIICTVDGVELVAVKKI